MCFSLENPYQAVAACALLVLVLGAAIFFWGRGIRNGRKSDLIAGPAILVALCITLLVFNGSSAVFEVIGGLLMVFGAATVGLSFLTRPGVGLSKRDVSAIGVGAIFAGLCLSVIV